TPMDKELGHDMLTSLITANTERNKNRISISNGIPRPMTDVEIRVKQKMIAEIDSIFPQNTPLNLKYEDLLKLEYCDAIFNEVSRMIPIALDISRYLEYPSELAGYRWEAGTYFHMNITGIHYHKDAWSNPEVFDPDRFYKKDVANNLNNKTMPKFSLIPFGGGLRMCPGRKLAIIELLSLMVMVFGKYDVELIDMKAPLQIDITGLSICKELPIRIRPRKLSP
ncbi:13394_t:CDS:2, partial [Cetraspora pellucida]